MRVVPTSLDTTDRFGELDRHPVGLAVRGEPRMETTRDGHGRNGASQAAATLEAAMLALPQPLHLVAAFLDRQHYHFGLFLREDLSLSEAQEALAEEVEALLPANGHVLDVGCGLGGTSRLLASHGHDALGIDPCPQAIAFARATTHDVPRLRFVETSFQALSAEGTQAAFDAIVLIEVLQHLPPLDEVLRRCARLVRPGGTIVIADISAVPELLWERAPFHRVGSAERSAGRAGLECVARRLLTAQIEASPNRFAAELESARERLHARLGSTRLRLDAEIDEVVRQCALLAGAFRDGDVHYELTALRRPLHSC